MKEKDRDIVDDLFRSKLQGFEVDTMPGDWEAISNRLPGKAPVPFRRTLRYWAAAAVVSLLVATGSVYLFNPDKEHIPVASIIREKTDTIERELAEQATEPVKPVESSDVNVVNPVAVVSSVKKAAKQVLVQAPAAVSFRMSAVEEPVAVLSDEASSSVSSENESVKVEEDKAVVQSDVELRSAGATELIADASPIVTEKKAPIKRWGFGMGGGSVTAGTTNSVNTYAFRNTLLADPALMEFNSPYFDKEAPRTNIDHKTPVTVGMGVSYYLNDRFSLQSGLNYTFLSSEWETNGEYHNETKQKLHFIGIPLSLSYKIAEWKRVQFYAAAGAMAEINVAGKLKTKTYKGDELIGRDSERIRMRESMWSVNARVGASYPLLRFLSVYAEAGAGYYFDNGSNIETIRSEKPFNVNLQAGFRFGF